MADEAVVRAIEIRAMLEPRPGGSFRFELMTGEFCSGRYVELVPGRRVVFTWVWRAGRSRSSPQLETAAEGSPA